MDERQLLERALRGFEPEPGLAERVMRRRERKRRNQRIRAGVLGGVIALALAVAFAATRPMFDKEPVDTPTPTVPVPVGFIGLPPAGIVPTGPVTRSDLVLSLDTTVSVGDSYKTTLFVYADGRLIWERHAGPTGVPEGAKPANTGYLQQTLTPEGVELLKDEVISSGLFEEDVHLQGGIEANGDIYGVRYLGAARGTARLARVGGRVRRRPEPHAARVGCDQDAGRAPPRPHGLAAGHRLARACDPRLRSSGVLAQLLPRRGADRWVLSASGSSRLPPPADQRS